jgi:hypothetical protein
VTLLELEDQLSKLQRVLMEEASFPCTRRKDGKACVQQHDRKLDRKGRTVFYFAIGCKVVETFCPACLTYWLIAVARNSTREIVGERYHKIGTADADAEIAEARIAGSGLDNGGKP